jgi:hypothetical protein
MKHSLSEADSRSDSQETPNLLWNPKVRYRVHNSSSQVLIRSQMHPVQTFPLYFPKIHLIYIIYLQFLTCR